jgi:GNAT superfamily N-acetyltransferase
VSGYDSQVLRDDHDLVAFTCGKEALDGWLKHQARRAHSAGTARTYVWTEPGSSTVLAYYSIAPTQISRSEVPSKLAGGYSVVPAYLLARLALDLSLRGQALGVELLLDALEVITDAARIGGGRLIVVDAVDEQAATFYRRNDFVGVQESPRLYLKMADAEAVLAKMSE